MLLEGLDNTEIIGLLDEPASLQAKIHEALAALRLYALIQVEQGPLAGKIAGMLWESLDNTEIIGLIDEPASLQEKIHESLAVLLPKGEPAGRQAPPASMTKEQPRKHLPSRYPYPFIKHEQPLARSPFIKHEQRPGVWLSMESQD